MCGIEDDDGVTFEWDDAKAAANVLKHRVSFEEAETVFTDPFAGIAADPDHSIDEPREIAAGLSAAGRLLLVCFVERHDAIRIISARELTSGERRLYEKESFP
jgi:uncharacterized DUF497 family protein